MLLLISAATELVTPCPLQELIRTTGSTADKVPSEVFGIGGGLWMKRPIGVAFQRDAGNADRGVRCELPLDFVVLGFSICFAETSRPPQDRSTGRT